MTHLNEIRNHPDLSLAAVAASAAAGFAAITSRSVRPRTILQDLRLRARIPRYGKRSKKAAVQFGYLGKEWSALSIAGLVGAKLLEEDSRSGAAAVMAATLAAIAASHIFDATLPQKTPPPGRRAPRDPHFPSGHALHSGAVLAISAWVLGREGLANRKAVGTGAAVLAAALGFDRLIQDRHWTSDVVAGWLAAISIAGLAAAAYERANRGGLLPRRSRR